MFGHSLFTVIFNVHSKYLKFPIEPDYSLQANESVPSLFFKVRLSVKLLVWKWILILMQRKLIFTRKVLQL